MTYLCTRIRTSMLHNYSIAMEIYAALFNCTMAFIDNGAACNTPVIHKGLFPSSQKHIHQYIIRSFEYYCSPEEESSTYRNVVLYTVVYVFLRRQNILFLLVMCYLLYLTQSFIRDSVVPLFSRKDVCYTRVNSNEGWYSVHIL